MFLALFKYIASARSRSMRGVSQPAFMSSCLIISYTCFSCLSSRRVRKFPCVSQGGGGGGGVERWGETCKWGVGLFILVFVEGIWMIKLMVVGF